MSLNKMVFLFTLITGTLISISSYSWMSMWLGLEINLLAIIPLMNSSKNSMTSEAMMKYFITQTLASLILLMALIMMSFNLNYLILNSPLAIIYMTALFTKMGAAPFHFWFPEIIQGLSWTNAYIMLTWQKIAPFMLLSYANFNYISFFVIIIIFSSMVSGIMGMNQTSIKKILAYSSINHISWMLASMLFFEKIWMYYFIIYAIITFNIVIILKKMNIFYLNQIFSSLNNNPLIKFFFMLNFMSLGGLPPFLGFLPKWLTIQILIKMDMFFLAMIIIIMTLVTLFFYMRIITLSMLMNLDNLMFKNSYMKQFNNIYLFNFIILMSLLLITISFNMF